MNQLADILKSIFFLKQFEQACKNGRSITVQLSQTINCTFKSYIGNEFLPCDYLNTNFFNSGTLAWNMCWETT